MSARFLHIVFIAFLLAGCAAYNNQDWPDLSQGFDGAYVERRSSDTQPDILSTPEAASTVTPAGSNELLRDNFSALQTRILAQREIYENAKEQVQAEADGPNGDGDSMHWRTAQLELTRLSQLAEELLGLFALAGSLSDQSGASELGSEIFDFRAWLEQYIASERIKLAELG